jgi:3-oxoacyl-ACP reductase-like protein
MTTIFGQIKDAIFGHDAEAALAAPAATAAPAAPAAPTPAPPPVPASAQEVEQRLRDIAAKKGVASNYNESIVDLMKLLDLDSSLDNRKQLASELGYTGALDGSAEMNMWLHKQVMASLANRGR